MVPIFLKLVNMSISASWLIFAIFLFRIFFKKAPKRYRMLLWTLAAVRLGCPFAIESPISAVPSAETISYDSVAYADYPEIRSGVISIDHMINPVMGEHFSNPDAVSVSPGFLAVNLLAWLWAAVAALFFIYSFINFFRLKKKVSASIRLKDNIWICDNIPTPFIFGMLKPAIYLPSNMSEQYADFVIRHEETHLKRMDHWRKAIGYTFLIIYCFNPILWIAYIFFCRDLELCCDEIVIGSMDLNDKKAYSNALLSFSAEKFARMSYPLGFGEVGVKSRIKEVLRYKRPAFWLMAAAIILCIIAALCFLTNPKTLPKDISQLLDTAISEAVLNENKDSYGKGGFSCEDHVILGTESQKQQITVYMMSLYEEYVQKDGGVEAVAGGHSPVALTFQQREDEAYSLTEYWIPEDGNGYLDSIKEKFPRTIRADAMDASKYVEEQKQRCLQKAKAYFDSVEGDPAEMEPGGFMGKTYKEVQEYLMSFSNDADALVKEGCFVIGFNQIVGGLEQWNAFCASINKRVASELVLAQFTDEGDAILDYLYYDGSKVYHVSDSTRDGFAAEGNPYFEETFLYLKVFDEIRENGDKVKSVVLTNDSELTGGEWRGYLASGAMEGAEESHRLLALITMGNEHSEIEQEYAHHDVSYTFDLSKVLIEREQIAAIRIMNGNIGTELEFAVTDESNTFNEILDLYYHLNVRPDEDMTSRSGYSYSMVLLDEKGEILQRVTPYKDAVSINWKMYDGSLNGTTTELLLKLDALNWGSGR